MRQLKAPYFLILYLAAGLLLSGCPGPSSGGGSDKGETTDTVSITVNVALESDSNASVQQVNSGHLERLISVSPSTISSLDEIGRITVGVENSSGEVKPVQDLSKTGSTWELQMSGLPANVALTFNAVAYDKYGNQVLEGMTVKTLNANGSVSIPLSASLDPKLFYITSINFTDSIDPSATSNVSISLEGKPGLQLTYQFDPQSAGGTFAPQTGNATLDASGKTLLNSVYTAPTTEGSYTHHFSIMDGSVSVKTSFVINVVNGGGGGSNIVFNPWINGFTAGPRVGSNVSFKVMAGDDKPVSELVYLWSYDNNAQFPTVAFINSTTAEATLINYNQTVTGTVLVTVTDADGGSSSLSYKLEPGLFPDCIINCGVPTARAGSDYSIEVGNPLTLDGSGSSDPNDATLLFNWEFSSKPALSSSVIANPTTSTPSFTPDTVGTYSVNLTVNNGSEADADSINIHVTSLDSSVVKPTLKMVLIEGSTYKLQLLSSTEHQPNKLTALGGVSLDCPGISALAGYNGYNLNSDTINNYTVLSFEDLDNELSVAGAEIDICSFSCTYLPSFALTDSVSVSYENTPTISGTANINHVNP